MQCGYELSVTFHYSNISKDILAHRVNCDDLLACESIFLFCVRSLGAPVDITSNNSEVASACSEKIESIDLLMDSNSTLLDETLPESPNFTVDLNGAVWVSGPAHVPFRMGYSTM